AGMDIERAGHREVERGRVLVHVFRSSSPAAALGFGNEWSGRALGEELRALHPHELHWMEYEAPELRTPSPHYTAFGRRIDDGEIWRLVERGTVVFQGPRKFLPRAFDYEDIAVSSIAGPAGCEGLFLAKPKGGQGH